MSNDNPKLKRINKQKESKPVQQIRIYLLINPRIIIIIIFSVLCSSALSDKFMSVIKWSIYAISEWLKYKFIIKAIIILLKLLRCKLKREKYICHLMKYCIERKTMVIQSSLNHKPDLADIVANTHSRYYCRLASFEQNIS